MRCLLGILVLLVAALAGAIGAAPAEAAKKRPCVRAYVAGAEKCVRAGQACRPAQRRDYLVVRLECRRRKLTRARESVLRGPSVVYLRDNGLPSFQTALQAFDMLVADIPGAKRRRGVVGRSLSGTAAIRWLMAYERRLNRRQRAVLRRVLAPARAVRASQLPPPELEALVQKAKERIEAHGPKFLRPVRVVIDQTDNPIKSWAYTVPEWLAWKDFPVGEYCTLRITPEGIRKLGNATVALIAHELIHCTEAQHFAGRSTWRLVPDWIGEGFATWGGAVVGIEVGGSPAPMDDNWPFWLKRPEISLSKRDNDALGFWQLLAHEGVDVWATHPPVAILSALGDETRAYSLALGSGATAARVWGPTLFSVPGLGRNWDLGGPGNPGLDTSGMKSVTIGDGDRFGELVPDRGARIKKFDLQAEIVKVTATSGQYGLLRTPNGADKDVLYDTYCTLPGGCVCDDGTDLELEQIGTGPALLGIAGIFSAGRYEIVGQSVDERCGDKFTLQGIEVFGPVEVPAQQEYKRLPMIERIKSVRCATSSPGNSFTASGSAYGSRVSLQIGDYQGPDFNDGAYPFELGDENRVVEYRGPGGFFSTLFKPSIPELARFGGLVGVDQHPTMSRRLVAGAAVILLFNKSGNRAVQVLGTALCARR